MRRAALVALSSLVVATACGAGSTPRRGEGPAVFAAASLTEVFRSLAPDARFNFAGSDELALQIREGAPADVYASADPGHTQELFEEGLVETPQAFATNSLVLIVPRSDASHILSVADVSDHGVRLVIGARGVPVGDYAREVLRNLGQSAALRNVVSEEQDVKEVVGKVALGEADAGFVYATDVAAVAERVRSIELPRQAQPEVRYVIAIVAGTDSRAKAESFVDLVLGDTGRGALRKAGFGLP